MVTGGSALACPGISPALSSRAGGAGRVKYITRADVPVLPSVSARKSTGENTRNEEHGDINIYTIYNV